MPSIPTNVKKEVEKRAQGYCEYCKSQSAFSPDSFSIEHIIPRSKGGNTELDNLALACQGCNNAKYNHIEGLDPITGQKSPLFNPRRNNWQDHFTWNHDFTQLIGISSIGRTTVQKLRLNRPGVKNLRSVLHAVGKHP